MKNTLYLVITLFVLAGLLLASCATGDSDSLIGEWTLVSYGDASNPMPAVPDVETSINFDSDGKFGGNVGCNSFGGDYEVNGNQITFGSIISTLMFCEETSDQETSVLGILTDKTVNYQIDGDQLTLTSSDGASVVVLARK